MARPPSVSIARRDDGIYVAWKHGTSLRELAERHNLTPQRIGQIIAAYHPELEDETMRAMHRGLLENLRHDVQEMLASPGWKMTPNGHVAKDDEGNPVPDTSAGIEAARTLLAVLESARKLDGVDRPSKRQVQHEFAVAEQAAIADIAAKRAELDSQLRVIQGSAEPVERPELPPAAEG